VDRDAKGNCQADEPFCLDSKRITTYLLDYLRLSLIPEESKRKLGIKWEVLNR